MPEAAPAETGATMIDPKWAHHSDAAGRSYWFNASTASSQWERPPFLFRAATAFPPGSTVSVSNPYDGTALTVAFPQGADPTQWHAIPAPAQQPAQAQQQLHAQQQALRQQAIARQQAEAARQAEELEYQADDPDSDLANAAEVEIYETYKPQKLKIGTPHPDPVVEASCLSTVPSPDITYLSKLRIHKEKHQVIPTPPHFLDRISHTSSPFFPVFPRFFARFHRLDEAVLTSPKPEPRAKRQWQGRPNTVLAV